MEDRELEILLEDLESHRIERKSSLSDPGKIREAICAFANDLPGEGKPGVIFVGVNDDGSFSEFQVTDERLRTLADMRSDGNITPFPTMTVEKRTLKGHDVAVVVVQPSNSPPVRYRGRTWVRVGPRKAFATPEEERRLSERRRSKDLPFDLSPVRHSTLDDLDKRLFLDTYVPSALPVELIEQNERSVEEQLQSLRFATTEEEPFPTVVGLLTVGKEPRQFLPGVYVQFLRIEGKEITDPIKDQKEIDGPLPGLLSQLDEIFRIHISVAANFTSGPVEIRVPDYPLVALQQIARNAILHRNYEGTNAPTRIYWFIDRVEILSPGGPFGQVTRDNFGKPGITDYRNPHLAETMRNLGYVQRFGIGIQLARKELEKNGNPPPDFLVDDSQILVTLRSRL